MLAVLFSLHEFIPCSISPDSFIFGTENINKKRKIIYLQRLTVDAQLEQMVYSQSTAVDTIMKDSSDDLGRFITYLRQR